MQKLKILILLSILGLCLLLPFQQAYAEPNAIIGKAVTNSMVYRTGATVPVVIQYSLENQTEYLWTYQDPTMRTFQYEVFNQNGVQVTQGTLLESLAQYVSPGQSDVFAYGTITLLNPAKGFYRIFIYAPMFHSTLYSSLTKNPSAGIAIQIVGK